MPKWLLKLVAVWNHFTTIASDTADRVQNKAVNAALKATTVKLADTEALYDHAVENANAALARAKIDRAVGTNRAYEKAERDREAIYAIAQKGSRK